VFGRLARRGHEVVAVVSGWPGASRRETLDGMDVHRVGARYTYNLAAPPYYRRRLRARHFDVVIEDLNKVPLFTPLWLHRPLVLLVHHLFGGTAFREASLPLAAATWLLERPIPLVYRDVPVQAVSQSTAADLRHRGLHGPVTVIPNGVDLDFFRPDPAVPRFEAPTVLFLGRLQRYKRIDLIVQATARLRGQGLDVRLVIAGKGHQAEALRGLIQRLDLSDAVELCGFVDEETKRSLLRRAWVHVLTSPKEGWGLSNVEAAACGTPSVASDSPGLRDSVVDGETGFLVRHGDVDQLAGRLRQLLTDAPLRDRLGRQARAFAERHSWERAADLTEQALHALVQEPS
jgi:glycosyltransferase involved in cell wall biosynthesis